ncbi:MAG: helix-turn-helix transcriptional regulator [Roseovarius sp.]
MTQTPRITQITRTKPALLLALIAVQMLCAAFFVWDVIEDIRAAPPGDIFTPYMTLEALATLSLFSAIAFELRYLMRFMRRQAHLERQVSIAAGAFHEIMLAQFEAWGLTPSEADVAGFAIKGMTTAEIAQLRGAAEGTVKSQLNAVYRKAGVSGRSGLLGLLIDDLLSAPLLKDAPAP